MVLYYSWLKMIKPKKSDAAETFIDHKIRLYREDDGMY